jgi:RNA polymerase-binding transcription factor DksA
VTRSRSGTRLRIGSKVTSVMLKPEQIARFRKKLLAERLAIETRIAAREGGVMDTVRDEEGVGDNEDEAQLVYDREDDIVSNELDVQQLEQVKKALARVDAGTYGLSEVSGKPIPLDRLEAVPSATTLVNEEPA